MSARLAPVLAVFLALASPALAAKRKVPAQFPTIQAAVDAADPGDVVEVAAGVYREAVTNVPQGITIRGKGNAILDARDANGYGVGTALTIASEGVTIEHLTIRHAANPPALLASPPADGIVAYAGDVTIRDVQIVHCAGCAIRIDAPGGVAAGPRIERCRVDANRDGLVVMANHALIDRVEIGVGHHIGIHVTRDDALVTRCRIAGVAGAGILFDGADDRARGNRLNGWAGYSDVPGTNGARSGIVLSGPRGRAIDNRIDGIGWGIVQSGMDCESADNRVDGAAAGGVFAWNAFGGKITGNRVRRSDSGIVGNSPQQVEMRGNRIDECGVGFALFADGGPCRENIVADNVVRLCSGDGFNLFSADANTFTANLADSNGIDGFDVDAGADNVFDRNVARDNGAEGFENNGTNTSFTDNVAKGNRIDMASDGTLGTFSGNVPNSHVPPQID